VGFEDHVHLVVQMAATVTISDLMKEVKGASSHLVTHTIAPDTFFKWQGGYAIFGAKFDALPALIRYVHNQEEHHRDGTFDPRHELPTA